MSFSVRLWHLTAASLTVPLRTYSFSGTGVGGFVFPFLLGSCLDNIVGVDFIRCDGLST